MGARFRSWWQQIKIYRVAIGVVGIVLIVVIVSIIIGYRFDWTGFNGYNQVTITRTISATSAGTVTRTEEYQPGKTLWDWLQLLIIPIVIAIGGVWLNQLQKSREERHAEMLEAENQGEVSLQAYLAKMSELLLKEHLLELNPEYEEIRNTARVLTLNVLTRLDPSRKRTVLQFLYESGLINVNRCIIHLYGADLRRANLNGCNLSEANLSGIDLSSANLYLANLRRANLSEANLSGADLKDADISEALTEGATMPDGSIHP